MTALHTVETEADFLDLVYEAAVEPELWTRVLERFAEMVGGSEANLIAQDETTCEGNALSVMSDPAAMPLYLTQFIKCNPFLKTTDLPLGLRVITDEHKLPKQELVKTEFYNDFMRTFDCHSFLITRLALQNTHTTVVTIVRPARREPFDNPEIETAKRLHPHLIRGYRLAVRLTGMRQLQDSREALLDGSLLGVFVLDVKGVVRHVNRAGTALLASNHGLAILGGILRASSPDRLCRLHAMIATAGERDTVRRSGGAMSLPRPGGQPLSVSVVPLRGGPALFFDSSPSVLVCVSDPEADVAIPERKLRDLLGLSPAEARVAAQLLEGHEPRKIAERLGLSFYTVRGHLVRIFDKTGVSRQAELIRLMTRAAGLLSE